ncbi:MAG: hypothetical protein HC897_19330, partial [Thermoanaerobaculia bacterium]|nr:hypothetical protein [Thermoanaerobaculia bacterium]
MGVGDRGRRWWRLGGELGGLFFRSLLRRFLFRALPVGLGLLRGLGFFALALVLELTLLLQQLFAVFLFFLRLVELFLELLELLVVVAADLLLHRVGLFGDQPIDLGLELFRGWPGRRRWFGNGALLAPRPNGCVPFAAVSPPR